MNCAACDPLVTPYVDGQLTAADREAVEAHLCHCPPCQFRADAERAVRALILARKVGLCGCHAPAGLYERCKAFGETDRASAQADVTSVAAGIGSTMRAAMKPRASILGRFVPVALAASLTLIVSGAVVYRLTESSSRVMAAELAADHVKCFTLGGVLHSATSPAAIESAMLSGFGWNVQLPRNADAQGLELVGARPCLYGEGRVAHIMYRYHGEPVSVFMLPKSTRNPETVDVLGHCATIWCANDRTFVLITREPRDQVRRLASFVQASLH